MSPAVASSAEPHHPVTWVIDPSTVGGEALEIGTALFGQT